MHKGFCSHERGRGGGRKLVWQGRRGHSKQPGFNATHRRKAVEVFQSWSDHTGDRLGGGCSGPGENAGAVDYGYSCGSGEKWPDLGYVLEVKEAEHREIR